MIKNQGFRRLGGLPYLQVPCGCCFECQEMKSDDYFVRAWSLWKSLDPMQWSVFFVTLTFRPEDVPSHMLYRYPEDLTFNLEDLSDDEYNRLVEVAEPVGETLCFDHSILQCFMKSYRQYYRRMYSRWHYEEREFYIPPRVRRDGIRVKGYYKRTRKKVVDYVERERLPHLLVTCEYGETTHRPHYHAIVFVPRLLQWQTFKAEIERFWHYGFTYDVRLVDMDGLTHERTLENAFKYVLKYVSKGSAWTPDFVKDKRLFFFDLPTCAYMPRVFTTNNFGAALLPKITAETLEHSKVSFSIGGKPKSFHLPRYYVRRLTTYTLRCVWPRVEKRDVFGHTFCTFKPKPIYETRTMYREGANALQRRRLAHQFGLQFSRFVQHNRNDVPREVCRQDYIDYMLRHWNHNFDEFPKPAPKYKSLLYFEYDKWLKRWIVQEKFVPLHPIHKPKLKSYGSIPCYSGVLNRLVGLVSDYDNYRRRRRMDDKVLQKNGELQFYRLHGVNRRVQ